MGRPRSIPIPLEELMLVLFPLSNDVLYMNPIFISDVISTKAWHISIACSRLSRAHGPAMSTSFRLFPTVTLPMFIWRLFLAIECYPVHTNLDFFIAASTKDPNNGWGLKGLDFSSG